MGQELWQFRLEVICLLLQGKVNEQRRSFEMSYNGGNPVDKGDSSYYKNDTRLGPHRVQRDPGGGPGRGWMGIRPTSRRQSVPASRVGAASGFISSSGTV